MFFLRQALDPTLDPAHPRILRGGVAWLKVGGYLKESISDMERARGGKAHLLVVNAPNFLPSRVTDPAGTILP